MNALTKPVGLAFGPFLWKEWRDQRASLIALLVAAPLLVAGFAIVAPARFAGGSSVPACAAGIAFAAAAFAFCGEVFAGEERRETFAFLRRQPSGWAPPFLAKYLFLGFALLGVTAWAWGCAVLATWMVSGIVQTGLGAKNLGEWILLIALVPAWAVTVSIWFPRSVIALPAATMVLLLFASPIALAGALNVGFFEFAQSKVPEGLAEETLRILVFAAPLVALLSYVRGRIVERGRWRAGVVGACATFVLFTPAYAWTASRIVDFRRVDPAASTFRIESTGCISKSGRFAYLNTFQAFHGEDEGARIGAGRARGDGPLHALRVDLRDGSWREFADSGARVFSAQEGLLRECAPYVVVHDASAQTRPPRRIPNGPTSSEEWPVLSLFDAESGERLRADIDASFLLARDHEGARQQESSNFLVLPDGGRVWFESGHLVTAMPDGSKRELPHSELEPDQGSIGMQNHYGHGVRLGRGIYYDAVLERRFVATDDAWVRWIRRGECIVLERDASNGSRASLRWNPDTYSTSPIVGLSQEPGVHEFADEMADDGRLFVGQGMTPKEARKLSRLFLLDPDTGTREELPLPECLGGKFWGVSTRARTPSGVPVMSFWTSPTGGGARDTFRYARFDLAARRFDVAAPEFEAPLTLLGCDSEDSVLVTDGRRLLRARFGKTGAEVVFPK